MKNYVRRYLPNLQVLTVYSLLKGRREVMRQIQEPYIFSGIPSGHFVAEEDAVLLPKRRRGEKFVVRYTVMHEAVL